MTELHFQGSCTAPQALPFFSIDNDIKHPFPWPFYWPFVYHQRYVHRKLLLALFIFKLNFLIARFYEFLIYSAFLISYMTCNYFLPAFVDSLFILLIG